MRITINGQLLAPEIYDLVRKRIERNKESRSEYKKLAYPLPLGWLGKLKLFLATRKEV